MPAGSKLSPQNNIREREHGRESEGTSEQTGSERKAEEQTRSRSRLVSRELKAIFFFLKVVTDDYFRTWNPNKAQDQESESNPRSELKPKSHSQAKSRTTDVARATVSLTVIGPLCWRAEEPVWPLALHLIKPRGSKRLESVRERTLSFLPVMTALTASHSLLKRLHIESVRRLKDA
ncbi:hypothetical protein QQF64_006800 [Cirrhinus molitorella]|uniref:Uncharacterized protein n=1 Tax=Cirrhinus molitorella TaxID=172907 RepID=A0ABR3MA99_9TELE